MAFQSRTQHRSLSNPTLICPTSCAPVFRGVRVPVSRSPDQTGLLTSLVSVKTGADRLHPLLEIPELGPRPERRLQSLGQPRLEEDLRDQGVQGVKVKEDPEEEVLESQRPMFVF